MTMRAISLAAFLAATALFASCGAETDTSKQTAGAASDVPIVAKSFEIALNPAPGRPAAGYGIISGPANAMLTGVTSDEASRVELHIIERQGNTAQMKKVDGLLINSDNALTLAQGGSHLMLFDVAETAADDGVVPLTLTFDTGASLSVEAKIKG